MKKTNNKGFTLVELIVVLVILAILAAILVPALLGYIDKAREKQVTTNAEAAYVAAQALATEAYGKNMSKASAYVTSQKVKNLTDIDESFTIKAVFNGDTGTSTANKTTRQKFIIKQFTYKQTATNGKQAVWYQKGTSDKTVAPGGWWVGLASETAPASK